MVGRNQHNIPQFLQRSFGVAGGRKPTKIWEYRKGCNPELVKIEDTGAGLDFYSSPTEPLDDKITAAEKLIFKHYAGLSQLNVGEKVAPDKAASVISHLAPRSAHIREMFQTGVSMGFGIMRRIADPKFLYRYLGLDADTVNETFIKRVLPTLEKSGIFNYPAPRDLIIQMVFAKVKESPAELLVTMASNMTIALEAMELGLPSVARDGHNKAISTILDQNVRYDDLRLFDWAIVEASNKGAILPDCIALSYDEDGNFDPYIAVGLGASQVVMPVHRKRLLVGTKPGFTRRPVDQFNEQAIRCSHTFFLAATEDPYFAELSGEIGCFYDKKFEEVMADAFSDFTVTSPPVLLAQTSSQTMARNTKTVGRNESCPCGSGKKYKKCCLT